MNKHDTLYAGKNSGAIVAIHETDGGSSIAIRLLDFRGRLTKRKDQVVFSGLDNVSLNALIAALTGALDMRALDTERWTRGSEAEETRGGR